VDNQRSDWENDWSSPSDKEEATDVEEAGGAAGGDGSGNDGKGKQATALDRFRKRYQNPFLFSVLLSFVRAFTLWKRDWPSAIASIIHRFNSGLSTGFVFRPYPDLDLSYLGSLYMLVITLLSCGSTVALGQMDDRVSRTNEIINYISMLSDLMLCSCTASTSSTSIMTATSILLGVTLLEKQWHCCPSLRSTRCFWGL
jgi:hypothetical protein